jgi:hypothetical protein
MRGLGFFLVNRNDLVTKRGEYSLIKRSLLAICSPPTGAGWTSPSSIAPLEPELL